MNFALGGHPSSWVGAGDSRDVISRKCSQKSDFWGKTSEIYFKKLGRKTVVGTSFWREQVAIGNSWEKGAENSAAWGTRGLRNRALVWGTGWPFIVLTEGRNLETGGMAVQVCAGFGRTPAPHYPLWPANRGLHNFWDAIQLRVPTILVILSMKW